MTGDCMCSRGRSRGGFSKRTTRACLLASRQRKSTGRSGSINPACWQSLARSQSFIESDESATARLFLYLFFKKNQKIQNQTCARFQQTIFAAVSGKLKTVLQERKKSSPKW